MVRQPRAATLMPMPQRPVVSLLTDFGLDDPFVGMMKGVILQRCAAARIIDLTHAIEPQDVRRAGYGLADSWRYFPPATIHVAVVDPGVGTDRAILAAAVDGHILIAPDNGLLTAVFEQVQPDEIRQVSNGAIFLKSISRTFHGRDIFAPTAGALAAGMPLSDVGPVVDKCVSLDLPHATVTDDGTVRGEVIYIDRFGNLVTNIAGPQLPLMPRVAIAGRTIEGLVASYGHRPAGELLAVIGSTGRLEIAINRGHAAATLDAPIGTAVTVAGRQGHD